MVHIVLQWTHDDIPVRAQHVRQEQLVAVPVGVDRLVERDLRLLVGDLTDVHEDLVFDAARGIGRELDIPVRPEGIDGLDEPDGADGNEVLEIDTRIFKPPRDIHDQAQVVLDERLPRRLVPGGKGLDRAALVLGPKRRGQNVAAADVHDLPRLYEAELLQNKFQFHPISPPINA